MAVSLVYLIINTRRIVMPYGKGTYGSKVGRPSKASKMAGRKKMVKPKKRVVRKKK